MRGNEIGRVVIIARILREFIAAHPDGDVLAHLEMQVRVVKTVRIADRGDLLPAFYSLTAANQNFLEMAVKRVDVAHRSSFAERVPDNDHVPPALMTIARKNNDAVADDVNWVAEVGVTATNAVPILAEMSM